MLRFRPAALSLLQEYSQRPMAKPERQEGKGQVAVRGAGPRGGVWVLPSDQSEAWSCNELTAFVAERWCVVRVLTGFQMNERKKKNLPNIDCCFFSMI